MNLNITQLSKLIYLNNIRKNNYFIYELNQVRQISFFRRKKVSSEEINKQDDLPPEEPIEKQSILDQLTEEQLTAIRDKSNLTTEMRDYLFGSLTEQRKFNYLYQYDENSVKEYYGKFGKQSGLKPGILWPSKEKLEYIKKYEETFYPKLNNLLNDMYKEKKARLDEIKAREKEIEINLKKLPKMKEEFYNRIKQREEAIQSERDKKEKLIQEVREYLGYDVDPKDARFQEALLKKEEEEKIKMKKERKQEKQARLLASLSALAEEQQEQIKSNKQDQKQEKKPETPVNKE